MSLKIVVDMNLTPEWIPFLTAQGYNAVYWRNVGKCYDHDSTIMLWAVLNGHVVLSNDLDFSSLLALTRMSGPSVVQIRRKLLLPDHLGKELVFVLRTCEAELSKSALVVMTETKCRIRILPL